MATRLKQVLQTALLLGACLTGTSYGSECVNYADFLSRTADLNVPAPPVNDVVALESRALVSSNTGFYIYDLADTWNPFLLGQLPIPAGGGALAVYGSLAYLISGSELIVIDFSAPSSPTIIGRVAIPPSSYKIAASSSRVCILVADRMMVIDVSQPDAPRVASHVTYLEWPHGIAVMGVIAYVSFYSGRDGYEDDLFVVDMTSADHPSVLQQIPFNQMLHDLAVDESTESLFAVGARTSFDGCGGQVASGLHRIDISTPAQPALAGQRSLGSELGFEVAVSEGLVGVLTSNSDSESPVRVTLFDQATFTSLPLARVIPGGRILSIRRDFLLLDAQVVGIGEQGSAVPALAISPAGSGGEVVLGNGLVASAFTEVIDYRYGETYIKSVLNYYDNSQPGSLRLIGGFEAKDEVSTGVALAADKAYLLTTERFRVFQLHSQANPTLLGSLEISGFGIDVDPIRQLVALGEERELRIVDVGNPSLPIVRSSLTLPGTAAEVVISGHRAYVASDSNGLQIVDITDADSPLLLGGIDTPGTATDVAVKEDRAVLASSNTLQIIDVADPSHPILISSLTLPAQASRLDRHGNIVYATCGWHGLAVADVSDDSSPALMAISPTRAKGFVDVAASSDGEYVYVSGHERMCSCSLYPCDTDGTTGDLTRFPAQCPPGVSPVEITQPEALAEGSSIIVRWQSSHPEEWSDFRLHRSEAADGSFTELELTWTSPAEGMYEFRDHTAQPGVTYFYRLEACDRAGGCTFYGPASTRIELSPAMLLGLSRPNPILNGQSATIRFTLPNPGPIRLRILDVNGRSVRDLINTHAERGNHDAVWDGSDVEGHVMPAGIYYWELTGVGKSLTRSVVKLR